MPTSDVVVPIRSGQLRGARTAHGLVFKGVPYAAPPVGANRFRPPEPVQPWTGIRDAVEYGPTAPKAPYPAPVDQLIDEVDIPGDDYLNVNIWTPDTAGALPVMVFIHGGGFGNGSNSISGYNGEAFARDGVVMVNLNHRLGAEGFLYLGQGDHPNLGLQDQVAALRWVQDNISAFGGDPGNVTVFGQSAGAMSIGVLLGMPSARGLFRRAILQSGASHMWLRPDSTRMVAAQLAKILEVDATLDAIAQVPRDKLVLAQQQLRATLSAQPDPAVWGDAALNGLPFEPVVDGTVVPGPPLDNLDPDVDLMLGTTTEEFRLYVVPNGLIGHIDENILNALVGRYGADTEKLIAIYRANRPNATPGDLYSAIQTDWVFRIPALRIAERTAPTWLYEFSWQPPTFDGRLGACHAAELPFVFDTLADKGLANLLGEDLPQELADVMHGAWVSFATTGNPGWPTYDSPTRATMRFDLSAELVEDPRPDEREIWVGVR
ncbi:carboxylesterase family protein [Actinocrispum sp. NPDC049592]|uniref:carboxylesterase/lipase family protein n=1 Tax=Actinocrispum sp. NPDC049592 TaxID=3154835 RepID=UPI00343E9787